MRAEAEPIAPRIITVPGKPQAVIRKIRTLIEDGWNCRILQTDQSGMVLITAPYHFKTDTSFGQPAGGRKYYTQLKIEVQEHNGSVMVELSHHHFEIRTSYAYNDYGKQGVGTMYKHYPYEEYPGMFNLDLINQEMDRVSSEIQKLFREYK